jgi:hypothetical protein
MIIEMLKPTRQILCSRVESICLFKTEPLKDMDIVIPVYESNNMTISIYRNVRLIEDKQRRIYQTSTTNNFFVEACCGKRKNVFEKIYIGEIEEVNIIFAPLRLAQFLQAKYVPTQRQPFKIITPLFSKYIKELNSIFDINEKDKVLTIIQNILEDRVFSTIVGNGLRTKKSAGNISPHNLPPLQL